jgi:class 3 adenylate cyclase/tetratricopeptide (TPR) repeat protein
VVCSSCSAENKQGAKFCRECGTPLVSRCPECGEPCEAGQRFCDECGASLADVADRPAVARPAPAATPPAQSLPGPGAEPELRFVSVLFVDLVGFTALSEGREAEDVRELLDRYFGEARTIVERYGGAIEKFIGDAVMAVWGAPLAREDDAERAVRAALEIVDAVAVFGAEVGDPGLRARAGVVTGQAAAVESVHEGLVVGDRVNTASRVQSAATPGSVLVDEVTRQVSSAAIAFEDAGEHSVKGKAEPLRLWRAVRVVAGIGGSEREEGSEAPFLGRDGELRLVKDQFHQTVARRSARLVVVSGEPGVGKTRLRREFSNYTDGLADPYLWHLGRCLAHGDGIAFWALSEMVRQRFGIPQDAPSTVIAEKLDAGLAEWIPDPEDRAFIAPRLGALLGVAEPGLGRAELFAGWRLFFERLASVEPVILVFEDMQWADQGLLEFIDQLLDWSTSAPIFVLVLARPELAAGREGWPAGRRGATSVHLEPLADDAVRMLLSGLVDGLPEGAADRIVQQAQGIPLYAIETVRALADRGVLAERDGRLEAVGEVGELEVPASLNALLASRLDALTQTERGLVKAMAAFGGAFARASAAALTDIPEDNLDSTLASLVRKQVLVIRADPLSPDRGQYAFAQAMFRSVVYETLPRKERKQRHLAAAAHLAAVFADDGEEVAEMIASHHLAAYQAAASDPDAAELRQRAAAALQRAARRAVTVGAPDAARRGYLTASELVQDESERTLLLEQAGEMTVQAGRAEEGIALLERAAAAHAAAGRDRERALTAYPIAEALRQLGRTREAAERITAALELLGPDGDQEDLARLNAILGRMLVSSGEYERAAQAFETALRIAQALELPDVLSEALNNKGNLYQWIGRPQEARGLLGLAVEVAGEHGLRDHLARAQGNAANQSMLWDLPGAREQTETAIALHRRRGDRYRESITVGNLLNLHLLAGRWNELEQIAATLLEPEPDRPGHEHIDCQVLLLAAARGRSDPRLIDRLAGWRDSDDTEISASFATAAAVLHLAEHQPAATLEAGLPMLTTAIEALGPATDAVRDAWSHVLEAALQLGRHDDARRILALLDSRPPGLIPPYLRAQLARGRALVNAAENNNDTVNDDLHVAIETFEKLGYPYWLAVTHTDLAAWLIDQGRGEEATPLLEHAIDTLTGLRATPALDRAEQLAAAPARTRDPVA